MILFYYLKLTSFGNYGQVLAKKGEIYAIYLPCGTITGLLNLKKENEDTVFTIRWYNPRTGKFAGKIITIRGGKEISLGQPPDFPREDWVVLIQKKD